MKYIYIINRFHYKNKTGHLIEKLKNVSRLLHRDYALHINDSPEEARTSMERYRNTRYIITAIGGDGSVNLLLNDLIGTDNILAFIPGGTGNDFYRVCRESFAKGVHKVDVIRINDRYFINTACFGIDADIANDDTFIHNPFIPKPLRYHAGALYHFFTFKDGRHMKVEWDDQCVEKDFMTVVAANGRYYGGGYNVSPESSLNDGLIELYLVDKVNRARMAAMILSMKHAGHLKSPALKMVQTNKVTITCDQPVKANIDGEILCDDHFDLELIPQAIQIDFSPEMVEAFKKL